MRIKGMLISFQNKKEKNLVKSSRSDIEKQILCTLCNDIAEFFAENMVKPNSSGSLSN